MTYINNIQNLTQTIDGFKGWSDDTTWANAFRGVTTTGASQESHFGGPEDMLGAYFSAPDADNDNSRSHCARQQKSGWWFNDCSAVNLNGDWSGKVGRGIYWADENGRWDNLKMTKMFIGPHTLPKSYPCIQNGKK